MISLVVLCEGTTEMRFVQIVLIPHLRQFNVFARQELLPKKIQHDVGTARGGVLKYEPVYRDIMATLRRYHRPNQYATTLFDFYAFPTDFPDYEKYHSIADPHARVRAFEQAMEQKVQDVRFVPHIQLHEYETLILAKPEELRAEFDGPGETKGIGALMAEIAGLEPEQINQTRVGAPSKRILKHLPRYRKTDMGPRIVERIGIHFLRASCPHFSEWISRLESLGGAK